MRREEKYMACFHFLLGACPKQELEGMRSTFTKDTTPPGKRKPGSNAHRRWLGAHGADLAREMGLRIGHPPRGGGALARWADRSARRVGLAAADEGIDAFCGFVVGAGPQPSGGGPGCFGCLHAVVAAPGYCAACHRLHDARVAALRPPPLGPIFLLEDPMCRVYTGDELIEYAHSRPDLVEAARRLPPGGKLTAGPHKGQIVMRDDPRAFPDDEDPPEIFLSRPQGGAELGEFVFEAWTLGEDDRIHLPRRSELRVEELDLRRLEDHLDRADLDETARHQAVLAWGTAVWTRTGPETGADRPPIRTPTGELLWLSELPAAVVCTCGNADRDQMVLLQDEGGGECLVCHDFFNLWDDDATGCCLDGVVFRSGAGGWPPPCGEDDLATSDETPPPRIVVLAAETTDPGGDTAGSDLGLVRLSPELADELAARRRLLRDAQARHPGLAGLEFECGFCLLYSRRTLAEAGVRHADRLGLSGATLLASGVELEEGTDESQNLMRMIVRSDEVVWEAKPSADQYATIRCFLRFTIEREGFIYLARYPDLGPVARGRTEAEALRALFAAAGK